MKSWDIFSLAAELDGYPLTGPEFVSGNVLKLADKFGIKYNIAYTNEEKASLKYNYFRAYKLVADFLESEAKNNPTEAFEKELTRRKWGKKDSIEYGLGCVNNFKDIIDLLHRHDFTEEFINLIGLDRADIFNSDSVIFTIKNERNYVSAFYSRDVRFEEKKAAYEKSLNALEIVKPKCPIKYNSTANFTGIYEKPLCPYGINDVKDFHKVLLVEGHGCKHSLKLKDVHNVIALGGLALSDETIDKLIRLGATALVLILDNDEKGKNRVKDIINKYYGRKPVDWYVVDLSCFDDIKDPDELLRKYSIDTFKQLPERNALEWFATQELYDKNDIYAVVESISPLIALERSPINRLKLENIISDMTGISKDIVHAEVEQKISTSKDRKSEYALKIFEEAKELISMNPDAISAAINLIETKVGALNANGNDEDLFSSSECLKELGRIQELEELGTDEPILKTGLPEFDKNVPLPLEEVFCLLMAAPNSLKSSLCINLCLGILLNNENAIVVIHTIDDSRTIYINRMIALLSNIKINWIKRPNTFLDKELLKKRLDAYKVISEYIRSGRLIIKDITHGGSVEYHGKLVQKVREGNPNRPLFVICDNLHRLSTEAGYEDGRSKYKYISGLMKSYTTKYSCIEFCTVEMTKQGMYEKPTTAANIAEAASLQFDANLILFIWNEMNVLREDAVLVHNAKMLEFDSEAGYFRKDEILPILEVLVLKNKISEFKSSLYYKAFPALAKVEEVSTFEIKELKDNAKKDKAKEKENKSQEVVVYNSDNQEDKGSIVSI